MPSIYIKPRPQDPKSPDAGVLQVRREGNGQPIPAAGARVELTPYIRRRLRDGDLLEARPPKASPAKPTAKADQPAGDQEA